MTPPKSILRKCTDMRKPIQFLKFTKATARHIKIRDRNPSLGYISPSEPHERSPNAPKFQDRSQEETEWQEQGAREAAGKLAKRVLKLKEHQRATFFSPSENRCLPASTLKPEEREFVVDSGASMHMISKKDLSNAEIDTLSKSCSPTIVIATNGEMQTHEKATVHVKELGIFLTKKVLENTPAVLSLGKLCDENGYSYEWIGRYHFWPKPLLAHCFFSTFGPTTFGHDHFWPRPLVVTTTFGPEHFWPTTTTRAKTTDRVCVKASRARDAFTQTRLMPTFGVSAGLSAEHCRPGFRVQGSKFKVWGSGFRVQVFI